MSIEPMPMAPRQHLYRIRKFTVMGKSFAHFLWNVFVPPPWGAILELFGFVYTQSSSSKNGTLPRGRHKKIREKLCKTFAPQCALFFIHKELKMADQDDITSCTVCFEDFDLEQHLPRILPCFHSLCTLCVQNMLKNRAGKHVLS